MESALLTGITWPSYSAVSTSNNHRNNPFRTYRSTKAFSPCSPLSRFIYHEITTISCKAGPARGFGSCEGLVLASLALGLKSRERFYTPVPSTPIHTSIEIIEEEKKRPMRRVDADS